MGRFSVLLIMLCVFPLMGCQKISQMLEPILASPDARQVLPPPPAPGSAAQAEDERVFRETRALKDTARWALAQHDADLSRPVLVHHFSCAVGYQLDLTKAPHLGKALDRLQGAIRRRTHEAKHFWLRQRPFVGTELPICTSSSGLGLYSSYPSGHTTAGYGLALVLARLLPDHAGMILQRGRIIGESRIICGVHWKSDVQSGYLNAATQMAVLLAAPEVQDDLKEAQKELQDMKKTAPAPNAEDCAAEKDAAAHSVLSAP